MAQARLPNGVTLEYELHGDPSNPVIFVVLGITDNITDWPPSLYEPLVEAGYCVVRHELRDSGRSTKFESAGRPDLAKAKEAVRSVLNGSELSGLWEETDDFAAWTATVDDLIARLA